jgi:hypothetical protein
VLKLTFSQVTAFVQRLILMLSTIKKIKSKKKKIPDKVQISS